MRTFFFFLLAQREHDLGAVDVGLDGVHRRLDDELDADRGREVEDHVARSMSSARTRLVHHRVDGT